jgi:hypothetical protein
MRERDAVDAERTFNSTMDLAEGQRDPDRIDANEEDVAKNYE